MKKLITLLLVLTVLVTSAWAGPAKFHIGICTGTVSQSEDELRSAEDLIKRYGDVADGGMIKHITYPDNFMTEQETTISQISAFADDPLIRLVIVNSAVPGTTEAFRRIKEKRPDIILFAAQSHEDPNVISTVANVVVGADNLSRGYLNIFAAKKLGATDFVHISFPRHMSYELLSRRARIFEAACKDLGLGFHMESAPDPTSDVGVAGAQQFILEKVPQWIDKYGEKAAFFCTNDAQTEPLFKRIAEGKGFVIEADHPSPLMGYPGALGVDLADVAGDFPAILKRIEEAVIAKGGSGRMGTWAFSLGYTHTIALAEYGKALVEKGINGENFRRGFKPAEVFASYSAVTSGSQWNGSNYVDLNTDLPLKNYLLIYQDTYIFGKGFLGVASEPVPEKYLKIR